MVQQKCLSDDPRKGTLYKTTSLQYAYATETLYSLVMIPNDDTQTYDAKIVSIDPATGACTDVVTGIIGGPAKWPYTC